VVKPRLLLRLSTQLKRLRPAAAAGARVQPADRAWHEMLRRLDAEDADLRLREAERALNAEAER
jgi:hypothetical protein